jgi:hypothetical protein
MGMLSHLTAAPQDLKREGRIALEVKSAKSHGQNKVELVAPIGMPTGISTVDEVLNHYSVVVAELVGKRVGADADDVNTWYKFREGPASGLPCSKLHGRSMPCWVLTFLCFGRNATQRYATLRTFD